MSKKLERRKMTLPNENGKRHLLNITPSSTAARGQCRALLAIVTVGLGILALALGTPSQQSESAPQAQQAQQQSEPQPHEVILEDENVILQRARAAGRNPFANRQGNGSEGPANILIDRACVSCHGKISSAPTLEQLRALPAETIYTALTTGTMKSVSTYSDEQKRAIAIYLSGKQMGGDTIDRMANACTTNKRAQVAGSSWSGWSPDYTNARYQSAAGLVPQDVQHLKVKWAFAAPGASSMYGQPVVDEGRIYVTDDTSALYSLDAATGCTHWVFMADGYMRGAPAIGKSRGKKTLFLSDVNGRGYAVDAATGKLLWKQLLDQHPLARISASPTYYEGHVYYPLAGLEEIVSGRDDYVCCTTRGAVISVDADTGEEDWKAYAIQQAPAKQDKKVYDREYWGPAGASVWAAPTIDAKRKQLYFVTGNLFAEPDTGDGDGMDALDLTTGRRIWRRQAYKSDFFAGGTIATGPDFDFSASPLIVSPDGRDLVVSGEKSGDVWALDPKNGDVVWHVDVNSNHVNGEITERSTEILFGGATDGATTYWGLRSGGLVALDAATGREKWRKAIPGLEQRANGLPSRKGVTAAVTLMPGAVFVGGLDGSVRAFSTKDGSEIWSYDTGTPVHTVNGVAAKGGSIGNAGPVIAEGMMFVTSGYIGFQGGNTGNLLLAFAPK
jgi:polyvinyl alcohol dehydrogenase (cytochrome)